MSGYYPCGTSARDIDEHMGDGYNYCYACDSDECSECEWCNTRGCEVWEPKEWAERDHGDLDDDFDPTLPCVECGAGGTK